MTHLLGSTFVAVWLLVIARSPSAARTSETIGLVGVDLAILAFSLLPVIVVPRAVAARMWLLMGAVQGVFALALTFGSSFSLPISSCLCGNRWHHANEWVPPLMVMVAVLQLVAWHDVTVAVKALSPGPLGDEVPRGAIRGALPALVLGLIVGPLLEPVSVPSWVIVSPHIARTGSVILVALGVATWRHAHRRSLEAEA